MLLEIYGVVLGTGVAAWIPSAARLYWHSATKEKLAGQRYERQHELNVLTLQIELEREKRGDIPCRSCRDRRAGAGEAVGETPPETAPD